MIGFKAIYGLSGKMPNLLCLHCDGLHVPEGQCSGKLSGECVRCGQPVGIRNDDSRLVWSGDYPVRCQNGHDYGMLRPGETLREHYKAQVEKLRRGFCGKI